MTKQHFAFYSAKQLSEHNYIDECLVDFSDNQINTTYHSTVFSTNLTIENGMLYIALGADKEGSCTDDHTNTRFGDNSDCGTGWCMKDFWVEIDYPDTSKLYFE